MVLYFTLDIDTEWRNVNKKFHWLPWNSAHTCLATASACCTMSLSVSNAMCVARGTLGLLRVHTTSLLGSLPGAALQGGQGEGERRRKRGERERREGKRTRIYDRTTHQILSWGNINCVNVCMYYLAWASITGGQGDTISNVSLTNWSEFSFFFVAKRTAMHLCFWQFF